MDQFADLVLHIALIALVLGALHRGFRLLRSAAELLRTATRTKRLGGVVPPILLVALSWCALLALPYAPSAAHMPTWIDPVLGVTLGVGLTWTLVCAVDLGIRLVLERHDMSVDDNLTARRVHTQYRVLLRIGLILIWVIGGAVILWQFEDVRVLGTGLLASAGLAGLVLGLAAQRTIGNFLAGVQIALTQPIRLDDAVVIDGEWGWIEDITVTYVVVKIWDERRLIVPFSRLLEQPFQNWTRARADLLGAVTLWVDHSAPIAALRQELQKIVEATDLWDRRVVVLQVIETSERAIQLRALVSARTSPQAWDLRCHVRERLLTFLAAEAPYALPTIRAEHAAVERPRSGAPSDPGAVPAGASAPQTGGLPGGPVRRGDDGSATVPLYEDEGV